MGGLWLVSWGGALWVSGENLLLLFAGYNHGELTNELRSGP
jgi:hypothetical protein